MNAFKNFRGDKMLDLICVLPECSGSIIVCVHGEEKEIKIIKNQAILKKKEQNPSG